MIQVVEHVPQERPYAIGAELAAAGLPVRVCRVWAGDAVPRTTDGMVALVVMGGPMSAYAELPARGGPSAPGEPPGPGDFPSRADELALLRAALEAEVPVLGVCLGAQLLAVAAGGVARPGSGLQIGWGEVAMTEAAHDDPLFAAVPDRLRVLHWHGDTMDLPPGATLLASCDRYPVQAFRIGGSAWGVQFHLEVDGTAVEAFAGTFPEEAATAPGLLESAPAELAALARHRDDVFERFAAFVAGRAERTA
ncbi:type 1 glutamine amidotransferase, partial [Streptomyces sp. NPDC007070]|uniref:type 1 glutamine amidotransferase n=1 Tax=Streptomyces sp. NPDC007070 TaxID=3154312 RepID=UPI0033CD18E9